MTILRRRQIIHIFKGGGTIPYHTIPYPIARVVERADRRAVHPIAINVPPVISRGRAIVATTDI